MNKYWIAVIVLVSFLWGLSLGTELGIQKGQYMLFEGLDGIFNGAEINIDLNETEMVRSFTDEFMPIFNQTLQEGIFLEDKK